MRIDDDSKTNVVIHRRISRCGSCIFNGEDAEYQRRQDCRESIKYRSIPCLIIVGHMNDTTVVCGWRRTVTSQIIRDT